MLWRDDPKFIVPSACKSIMEGNLTILLKMLRNARGKMRELSVAVNDDPETPEIENSLLGLEPFDEYVGSLANSPQKQKQIEQSMKYCIWTAHTINRYTNSGAGDRPDHLYPDKLGEAYAKWLAVLNRLTPNRKRVERESGLVAKNLSLPTDGGTIGSVPGIMRDILERYTGCPTNDLEGASHMAASTLYKLRQVHGSRAMAIKVAMSYQGIPVDVSDMRQLDFDAAAVPESVFAPAPTAPKLPDVVFNPTPGDLMPSPGKGTIADGRPAANANGWTTVALAVFAVLAVAIWMGVSKKNQHDEDLTHPTKIVIYGRASRDKGDYDCIIAICETTKDELEDDIMALSTDLAGWQELYAMVWDLSDEEGDAIFVANVNTKERMEDKFGKILMADLRAQMGSAKENGIWTTEIPW